MQLKNIYLLLIIAKCTTFSCIKLLLKVVFTHQNKTPNQKFFRFSRKSRFGFVLVVSLITDDLP